MELLNLGIPGMGPKEYLALLVREGLALEPDAVLLSFFVGNDFSESRRKARPLHTYSHVASSIHYLFQVLPEYEGMLRKRKPRIQKICARRGIALFVVVVPDEIQINAELQREVRREFFPGQPWNATRPNQALIARLSELGVRAIDLYPDFEAAAETSSAPLYRLRDSHWNIRGTASPPT